MTKGLVFSVFFLFCFSSFAGGKWLSCGYGYWASAGGNCAAHCPADAAWKTIESYHEGQNDTLVSCWYYLVALCSGGNCDPTLDPQKSNKNNGPPGTCVGNPINPTLGNKTQTEVDYRGQGPFPLHFARTYNNVGINSWSSALGARWSTNTHRLIKYSANDPTTAYAARESGKIFRFVDTGTAWQADPDITERLEVLRDGQNEITGWRYYRNDDGVEEYRADGKLAAHTNRSGLVHSYSYNTDNRLESITDAVGHTLQFTYDDTGRLVTLTVPNSGVYRYTFDLDANLVSVSYPDDTPDDLSDNPKRQFLYEDTRFSGALTGIIDENSVRYASWTYDHQARTLSSEHAGGVGRVAVVYGGNSSTVTNALGKQTTYHYEQIHDVYKVTAIDGHPTPDCPAASRSKSYDSNGFLAATTDWKDNITTYVHNSLGLETSRTEAYGTPDARTVTTEWHLSFRLPVSITEADRETRFTYDGQGQLLTRRIVALPSPNAERQWTYTYNDPGLVATLDGPRTDINDMTSYTYDAAGNLSTLTNALGHVTRFQQYTARGLPGRVISPNGVTTELTYNPRGWLTMSTVKDPGGNTGLDARTQYIHDGVGQVIQTTYADGSFVKFDYDDARRLIAIENGLGERIEYTLDTAGNRIGEVVKNGGGDVKRTLTRAFDELSRLLQLSGAAGQTVRFGYDVNDNNTQRVDGKNQASAQTFDALDRLIGMTDAAQGAVSYEYDLQDRLTGVTDQRGFVTRYTYNNLGDLIRLESPDTGITTFTHDSAGNVISRTDARGVVTTFQYDALNRLVAVGYPGNTSENVSYTYDGTDNGNYGKGLLTGLTDESGQAGFVYNYLDQLIEKRYTLEGINYSLSYAYDLAGNLLRITYPSGRLVQYTRDALGRVSQIITRENPLAAVDSVVSNISYLPFGPPDSYTYGNGVVHTTGHDLDYRSASISAVGTGTVLSRQYSYDLNNNISAITDQQMAAKTQAFTYDSVDRLLQASGLYGTISYQYDGVGNRTQRRQEQGTTTLLESLSYAADSNRLDRVDTNRNGAATQRVFEYDGAGNQVRQIHSSGTALERSYNQGNRYTALHKNDALAALYLMNALGQRVAKLTNNPATHRHYHYNEQGALIAESTGSGESLRETIYFGGAPVAVLVADSNRAPVVTIGAPRNGAGLVVLDPVVLSASASDPEQGDIATAIQWQSSMDGHLGSGATLSTTLSLGAHTLTASVADTEGLTGEMAVNVIVRATNQVPVLSVSSPVSGTVFTDADAIQFGASASDMEDGDLGDVIQWQSDLDGILGTGSDITTGLSIGAHQVTAGVTDSAGQSASEVIALVVIDHTDTDNDGLLDDWEMAYFGDLSQVPGGDFDGDQLTNLQEYQFGTNPLIDGEFNTLDPAKTHEFITLSNDKTTATTANQTWVSSLATGALNPGEKYYWELTVDYVYDRSQVMVGIGSDLLTNTYLGRTVNSYSWSFDQGGVTRHAIAWTPFIPFDTGDRLMVAFDPGAGKLWFGKNGTWQGDPAVGTGERFSGITGLHYAGVSVFNSGRVTVAFDNSRFLYTPPAGFVAPVIEDGDGDGMKDSWEYRYFSSLDQTATADFDNDGLLNGHEYILGTDPTDGVGDSDADGLPDSWEYGYFGDLDQNATTNFDGDEKSDLEEYQAGTDPTVGDTYNTLDPVSTNSTITLSDGNTTATTTVSVWGSSIAVAPLTAGEKYYWEAFITTGNTILGIGSDMSPGNYLGITPSSYGWYNAPGGPTINAAQQVAFMDYGPGDRVMIAFDPNAGMLWFGLNGAWQGDPVAGVGPRYAGVTGIQYPVVSVHGGGTATLVFAPGEFQYIPPVGFVASEKN